MKYDSYGLSWSIFLGDSTSSSGCGQTDSSLEGVIDPPLQTSKGTDHQDSGHETSPQTLESDLSINSADLLTKRTSLRPLRVQFRDHSVSRMRDNSTEDTSKVTRSKSNAQLSSLVVVLFALSKDVVVEELHEPFECHELDNSVRHLTSPKRSQTFVETSSAYIKLNVPSVALIWLKAPIKELGYSWPGLDSWIFSLTASQGQRRVSAMTSAEPEAIDHPIFLYYSAFCSPTIFL